MTADRHAQRLLRSYPRIWRERYGEEFAALLIDDITERPHSLLRDLDVIRTGIAARLSACGLARGPVQHRPAVIFVALAAAVGFVGSGLSIWTQLANGWLTAAPDTSTVTISFVALSIWLGGLLLLAAVACTRLGLAVFRAWRMINAAAFLRPLFALTASSSVLFAGMALMSPRWPGAQAPHGHSALAAATRVGWATTDTISTYWLHPSRLLVLSDIELAWMVLSPAAIAAFVWSLVRLLRVVPVSVPRAPWHIACGTSLTLLPALSSAIWVVTSQHASNATYRAGTLDLLLIGVMAAAARVCSAAWRTATG